MRKIRLSDTDLELFDMEIGPGDYLFYQKHKEAFRTMWREQGKPFWTRFQITFRSFTVKHGIIKHMNIDSPKFQNILDQAFIFIHEEFVDGKYSSAKNFIDDVAKLAQNQDKFTALDSKSFAKDPFFQRDTRELFRKFFGQPDKKSSYLKVYVLCPIYMRFGGSVCRCLIRWMDAPTMDNPGDDSYWIPPHADPGDSNEQVVHIRMCPKCDDDCGTKYCNERLMGRKNTPAFLDFWRLADPRFTDPDNPLFAPHANPEDDWRDTLSVELYRDFYNYARYKYGTDKDKCTECQITLGTCGQVPEQCKSVKKKKKQKKKDSAEGDTEEESVKAGNEGKESQSLIGAIQEVEHRRKRERLIAEIAHELAPCSCTRNDHGITNSILPADKETEDKKAQKDKTINGEVETKNNNSGVGNKLLGVDAEKVSECLDEIEKLVESGAVTSLATAISETVAGHDKTNVVGKEDNKTEFGNATESDKQSKVKTGVTSENNANMEASNYETEPDLNMKSTRNVFNGFKVIKIEDADNGLFEVNVSAATLKSVKDEEAHIKSMKSKLRSQELNNFILSADLLRKKIPGMPQRLEWWEGRGFAVAVLNYEEEEKEFTKKWTNFTLKVNGYDEDIIKQMLMKLLIYVSKRKQRICRGWSMDVDDVVACILPEEAPEVDDLSISISLGFRFEDRLTEYEKESLLKHHPNLNLSSVLVGIEKGNAVKCLEKKGGWENLKKIIETVSNKEIFAKDLPVVDVEKLRKKLNNKEEITKADILWEQMIRKPECFEFFVLLDKESVLAENDWWKYYMRTIDIRVYNETKDLPKICHICKIIGLNCSCQVPIVVEPKVVEFVESSDFENVQVLGEENGPELPKMKYTETTCQMDQKDKTEKKQKSSKAAKKKEKRIELTNVPAKFIEAGIGADKTSITIPTRNYERMMGKVPIPVSDRLERLAPVPGVQSSVNFTFQNGNKEQTITVTLGAYMPEDKINEIQEQKDRRKIFEEEERRHTQKMMPATEVKEKKKKKKEKPKPLSLTAATEPGDENTTIKEKTLDTASRFLKEIFGDEERLNEVTRTLHQHLGLSNKKQEEKKILAEKKNTATPEACTCPHHDEVKATEEEMKKMGLEKKHEDNTKVADKNGIVKRKRHRKNKRGENVVLKMPGESKSVEEDSKLEEQVSDSSSKDDDSKLIDTAEKEQINNEKDDQESERSSAELDMKDGLRLCGNCQKIEPTRKAYKKCQKCKEEGVLEVRYYCGRECQVEDWKKKHKMEHQNGLLG